MDDAASSSASQAGGLAPADTPAVLRAAADFFTANPGQWSRMPNRLAEAIDARGEPCPYNSADAVAFCALGYLDKIDATHFAVSYLSRAVRSDGHPSAARWNDAPERTVTDVIEALRRAADLAEAEQVKA